MRRQSRFLPDFDLSRGGRAFVLTAVLLTCAGALAADAESELNNRWRGAWVVIGVNTASSCGGSYTNNEVHGRLVSARASQRFQPGELARVYKVNLNRKRVEVLVDLAEPVLLPRQDGPFTLYDESRCKVELRFDLGKTGRSLADIEALLGGVLDRFPDEAGARAAAGWNRRLREPYPANYEEMLAEYETWKVFTVNAEVQSRIEESIEEAARVVDRLSDDSAYLTGLAQGVDDARDKGLTNNCERLVSLSESGWISRAGKEAEKEFRRGYEHGQRLVFHVERARRLKRCFVLPPDSKQR